MKNWTNAEIIELGLKCTEHGASQTKWVDEIRQDPKDPEVNWYSYSGPEDKK